jgi:hypothetical protein
MVNESKIFREFHDSRRSLLRISEDNELLDWLERKAGHSCHTYSRHSSVVITHLDSLRKHKSTPTYPGSHPPFTRHK